MQLVNPDRMTDIDRQTMEVYGLPPSVLMENAARSVLPHLPDAAQTAVLIGPGNNGGDGLVLARALHESGRRLVGLLFSENLSPLAEEQLRLAQRWEVSLHRLYREKHPERLLAEHLDSSDLVIDALFGIGLSRPLEGLYRSAAGLLEERKTTVIAVDIPSGLDGRTGAALGGLAIKASRTITFGSAKWGQVLHPGQRYVGQLIVTQPGFHPQALEAASEIEYVDRAGAARLLPRQSPVAHKGDNGRLLLAIGSSEFPGAGLLGCLGATHGGVGLPTLYAPSELKAPLMSLSPETMFRPRHPPYEIDLQPYRALVLGSGLGRDAEAIVPHLLTNFEGPVVLDAEALPYYREIPEAARTRLVLTPHPGELARLLKRTVRDLEESRIDTALEAARLTGCIVCFKGAPTVSAAPDGRAFVNGSGHPVLAQGGSGDILAGLIGAHLAYGIPPLEAAAGAAFLHGTAAELSAEIEGPRGVPPSRWVRYLPAAYLRVAQSTPSDCREYPERAST